MPYITPEAVSFLQGIRTNNNKEWFEPRKAEYLQFVYEPLKAFGELLFADYQADSDMMVKTARIYKDANFPPYQHYRDTMWIYIRHEAMYWSRTPSLFLELSPEGAKYGFRISSPAPAFMQYFREQLNEDAQPFLELMQELSPLTLTGELYKRPKPCQREELLPYFQKKNLVAEKYLAPGELLYSDAFTEEVRQTLGKVFPLYQYFHAMMQDFEQTREAPPAAAAVPEVPYTGSRTPRMVPAPKEEFMW